ncbi:Rgg/GadR/MutR family transcriptional regulator [Lactococcus allomyrinae]|uniref:Rgg/GadR/MutR family transcriptional regulator n=1 Tax=Lactococcus allomyrinae TaxID=2419773 RepID=A0A387BCL0_9LACT|nr:Rgg/GadR/MutR family transcriptional regulator [Lactococcus allomyrinae]AYG01543.1 Rgg/GadR/MutR family transcriptional regulator [Lactococcus allomyrinae]
MPYGRYGKTFKKIRTQKHLSLSYFTDLGISKAALDRFELGRTMMSFERVDAALQEMNVSLGEYEYFINDYALDYQEEILLEITNADIASDSHTLSKIYEEAFSAGYIYLAYAAKSRYMSLTIEEAEKVTDFLYGVEQWGYFELSIFYFALDNLSEREIMHLMQGFWTKNRALYNIFKYRRRILQSAYRAATLLSAKGYKQSAFKILQKSHPRDQVYDLYIQNVRKMALGFYDYCFENREQGQAQIQGAIQLFAEMDHQDLELYYQKRFERFKKEVQ